MAREARWSGLLVVGLLGGVGGAIDGLLCYARFPEPVQPFGPSVIPGGALHGAILAVVPLALALALAARPLALRLAAAPLVGWLAGAVSWIPLEHWAVGAPWPASLLWIARREPMQILWVPFAYFGLVGASIFLAWAVAGLRRGLAFSMAAGAASGVLGSLWWWIAWGRAYFAVIHGVVWGALVGLGAAGVAAATLTSPAPPPAPSATPAPPLRAP